MQKNFNKLNKININLINKTDEFIYGTYLIIF